MLARPYVTHAAVAAVTVVCSSRKSGKKHLHAGSVVSGANIGCLPLDGQWWKTKSVSCQARSTEIKRSFFIFQNPHGLQDYAHKGLIGDGAFSRVFLAVHKRTGQPRAIKKISKARTKREEFEGEVRALISLDHPHIVKVLEYFEDQAYFYVVMELCTGKDLYVLITEHMFLHKELQDLEREASIIIRQCLKSVVGCHAKGFIHRDLKPENFLLTGKDLTVKLIDFGLATRSDDLQVRLFRSGTQAYMAPEMILGKGKYNEAVDIWSLGVILFIMLSRELLLPDGQEYELLRNDSYVKRRLSEKLADNSEAAVDLIVKMLHWDPAKRITALEILKHPFIKESGCELLCDRSKLSRTEQPFDWKFDQGLPLKMERYAKSPLLRQMGLRCLVHLAAAATLPDNLANQVLTARHHFRSLDPTGSGQVYEHQLRLRFREEGIAIPPNFSEICKECQHSDCGTEAMLDYDVLVACILIDVSWPDALHREVFNIMDRSRDGVIEVQDLVELACTEDPRTCEEILQQVDPEENKYINYDGFLKVMKVDKPLFQRGSCEPNRRAFSVFA